MKKLFENNRFVRFMIVFLIGFFIWYCLYHSFAFSNAEYSAIKWEENVREAFAFLSMMIVLITIFISALVAWDPFD